MNMEFLIAIGKKGDVGSSVPSSFSFWSVRRSCEGRCNGVYSTDFKCGQLRLLNHQQFSSILPTVRNRKCYLDMNWLTKKRETDAYTFNVYRTYNELSKYKWIFKYESIHEFQ